MAHYTTGQSHDPMIRVTSPELTLSEALQSLAEYEVSGYSLPVSKKQLPAPRPLTGFLRDPQSIIPLVQKKTKSVWQRKHTRPTEALPPLRPNRPHPDQCPADQPFFAFSRAQTFPNVPELAPRLPEVMKLPKVPASCVSAAPLRCPKLAYENSDEASCSSAVNTHYNLTYNALTGEAVLSEDGFEELTARSDDRPMPEDQDKAKKLIETPIKNVGMWYHNHNDPLSRGSFSTLPSTISKMALKPSPLRLAKDFQLDSGPPIPIRSPLKIVTAGIESNAFGAAKGSSHLPISPPRRSSCDTMSVYSTDSDGHTVDLIDTPPSSPPRTPQHPQSQASFTEMDPYTWAEELRSELGIIDGIYDMFADTQKHSKHEACINEIGNQKSFAQSPSRVESGKVSRTQRRLKKQEARNEAARKLEGSKTDVKVHKGDFGQWLDRTSRAESCKDCSGISLPSSYDQNLPIRTEFSWELTTSSEDVSNVLEGTQQHLDINATEPESMLTDSDTPQTPELQIDYRPSLAILQKQLQALMEGNAESSCGLTQASTTGDSEQAASLPTTCSSTSTDGLEYGPADLQRIDIEWKGRIYPVLIGDRRRIWEGPCTDFHCDEHGRLGSELVYGMI